MRMSRSTHRGRLLGAGLFASALGAALLAAPTAALASNYVSMTPSSGLVGTTVTIVSSGTALANTAYVTLFPTGTPCGTHADTGTPGGNVAIQSTSTATFTIPTALVPTTGASKTYNVCLYNGTTTANAVAVDSAATLTVLPTMAPAGGPAGTTVTVKAQSNLFVSTLPGVIFTTNVSCPSNYTTTITGQTTAAATSITKVDDYTVTFQPPTTLTLNNNAVRTYQVCMYNGSAGTSTPILDNPQTFAFTPAVTPNLVTGPAGGGATLTFTAATGTTPFTGTPTVVFSLTGCPAVYGSPGSRAATNVTKVSSSVITGTVPPGASGTGLSTPWNICFYAGLNTTDTLIATGGVYTTTMAPITLSNTVGPTGGGNGITASSTANFLLGVTTLGANFVTASTCPVTYTSATTGVVEAAANAVRKLANNRLAATVPNLPMTNGAPTLYQACFYNGSTPGTSTLVGSAGYTSTIVHTLTAVTPSSGSALGNTDIVITGTGFPTSPGSIQATLGGIPLMNINPVSPNAFTATTPMHSVEDNVPLVVTTPAGTKSLTNAYTYLNDVAVFPNTAPNTNNSVDVGVKGVGFFSASFGASGTNANAHIYLVRGAYDATTVATGAKARGQVAECGNVLVISDTELACSMTLNHALDATGAYADPSVSDVTSVTTLNASKLITANVGSFKPTDVGATIVETAATHVLAGSTIAAVLSPTKALMNQVSGTTPLTVTVVTTPTYIRSIGSVTVGAQNDTALTGAPSTFQAGDVGKVVTSATGIAQGAWITAVAADGSSATLSAPLTAANAATVKTWSPIPVANGAYTLTFVTDGALDAATTDTAYSQSVISSGSTFTVAPA